MIAKSSIFEQTIMKTGSCSLYLSASNVLIKKSFKLYYTIYIVKKTELFASYYHLQKEDSHFLNLEQ